MPAATRHAPELPPDAMRLVFEALPARDRLTCRLVCRAWAMVPLEAARASRSATPKLLRRLAGMPAAWVSKPRARFDLLRLDVAWRSARLADTLGAALAAPSCARLAHLSLGDLRGDAGQEAIDVVCRAAPRLRTLVIGAAFDKPASGALRFRERGALPQLRALRITGSTRYRTTLTLGVPLQAVETVCLRNVRYAEIYKDALRPEARMTCFDADAYWTIVNVHVPVPRMNQPFSVADLLAASRRTVAP